MWLIAVVLAASSDLFGAIAMAPEGWASPRTTWSMSAGETVRWVYSGATTTPTLTGAMPAGLTLVSTDPAVAGSGVIVMRAETNATNGSRVVRFNGGNGVGDVVDVTIIVGVRPVLAVGRSTVRVVPGSTASTTWTVTDAGLAVTAECLPAMTGLSLSRIDPFDGGNGNWVVADPLPTPIPAATEVFDRIDYNPPAGANRFALVWRGRLIPNWTRTHVQGRSDDGIRLYLGDGRENPTPLGLKNLDNNPAHNESWSDHAASTLETIIPVMTAVGVALPIRVDFFQSTGGAEAKFLWRQDTGSSGDIVPASAFLLDATTSSQTRAGHSIQVERGSGGSQNDGGTITIGRPVGANNTENFTFCSVNSAGFASALVSVQVVSNAAPGAPTIRQGSSTINSGDAVRCNPGDVVPFTYSGNDDIAGMTVAVGTISPTGKALVEGLSQPSGGSSYTGSFSIRLDATAVDDVLVPLIFTDADGASVSRTMTMRTNAVASTWSYDGGAQQAFSQPVAVTVAEDGNAQESLILTLTDDAAWDGSSSVAVVGSLPTKLSAVSVVAADSDGDVKTKQVRLRITPAANDYTQVTPTPAPVALTLRARDTGGLSADLTVQITITARNDPCQIQFAPSPAVLSIPAGSGFVQVIPPAALQINDTLDQQLGDVATGVVLKSMSVQLVATGQPSLSSAETLLLQSAGSLSVVGSAIKVGALTLATWDPSSAHSVTITTVTSVTASQRKPTKDECIEMLGLVRYGWLLGSPPTALSARKVVLRVVEPKYGSSSDTEDTSSQVERNITLLAGTDAPSLSVAPLSVAPLDRVRLDVQVVGFANIASVRIAVTDDPRSGRIEDADGNLLPGTGVATTTELYYRNTNGDIARDGFLLTAADGGSQTASATVAVQVAYVADAFGVLGDPVLVLPASSPATVVATFLATDDVPASGGVACVDYPNGTALTPVPGWSFQATRDATNPRLIRFTATCSLPADAFPTWQHVAMRISAASGGGSCIQPISIRGAPVPVSGASAQ